MSLNRIFAAFRKNADGSLFFTKNEDGTIQVEGVASSESVDSQGEVIKASAIAAALPDYMKFPALREMHQPLAAGKTIAADVAEDGCTYITAKVVDPVAIKKVTEGVYAGFSIGGMVPPGGRSKDNPKIIETIKLSEISLVDRPANPDAVFTLVKLDAEPVEPAPVKKGMYTVQWAADLCGSLDAIANESQWEADFEGDSSPIPGRLKALCAEMCAILRDLVAEETAEMVGEAPEAEAVSMVNKPGALKKSERVAGLARALVDAVQKKGAKYSAATKQAMQDHHDELGKCAAAMSKLHKAFGDLGWKDEAKEDAVLAENLKKIADTEKRATDAESALEQAGEALKKVMGQRDELLKRLESKGVLKLVAVEKANDGGPAPVEQPKDPLSLMKAAHAAPLRAAP